MRYVLIGMLLALGACEKQSEPGSNTSEGNHVTMRGNDELANKLSHGN